MKFIEAIKMMYEGKTMTCESIDKMSKECEHNFGSEIVGYTFLKKPGGGDKKYAYRICVYTRGPKKGKYRMMHKMCFDFEDMDDDTWYVVDVKKKTEEILARY